MAFRQTSASRVANRFLEPKQQWKADARALAKHQADARRAFRALLAESAPLIEEVQTTLPKEKWRRAVIKVLKEQPSVPDFLHQYLGTDADHPKSYSWRSTVLYLLRDVALGAKGINAALKDLDKETAKGFRGIEMAKSQAPLREILPEELRAFLPVNIVVDVDDDGSIARITDRFENERLTLGEKIRRMRQIVRDYNNIVKRVKADLKSPDEVTRLAALVTAIIMETGIRPGKAGNQTLVTVEGEKVPVETFGAITLGPSHVKFVRRNFVELEFVGKMSTVNTASLSDIAIIRALQDYVDRALTAGSKYIFVTEDGQRFEYKDLQRYFRLKFKGLSPTDFRKLRATETVLSALRTEQADLLDRIREFAAEETDDLRQRVVEELVKTLDATIAQAQAALSHTDPKVTRSSYIDPGILLRFLSQGQADDSLHSAVLDGRTQLAFDPMTFVELALPRAVAASRVGTSLQDLIDALEDDLDQGASRVAARYIEAWTTRHAATEYGYHSTFLKNLDSIGSRGLRPGGSSQFSGGYTGHSRGRVFLSDRDGVDYWMSKMEDIAHHNSDFKEEDDMGWVPVALRVNIDGLEGELTDDELGRKDSGYSASWYVEEAISPEFIEVWTGSRWTPVRSADTDAMLHTAIEAATYESDDDEEYDEWGEPTGWWEADFEVFAP